MLTKITVEAALNVELDEHPGFARHEQSETDSRRYGSDLYSYDALGNVRSRQFSGSTRICSYDASHNRIRSMPGAGALSYDDRGNVSQAGTFSLTRNRANELIGDALGSSFAYDARGWRVKKHVIAGATHTDYFIYDSNHRLMERIDNGTRSDFVCLGQKAIARITNNKPSYIFGDYQNSPLFESNSAGSVTRAPNFVGYGHPDSTGVSEIPGYSGAAPDAETGLLYLGARYLYAERFLSPDPAALDPTSPVGLNRYAYANDNPVRFTDPDGRQSVGETIDSAAAGCGTVTCGFYAVAHAAWSMTGAEPLSQVADKGWSSVSTGDKIGAVAAVAAVVPVARVVDKVAEGAATAAERASAIQKVLSPRTQRSVTTAVTETKEGVRVVTSSEGRLRPAQRAALQSGEVAGAGQRGVHAEINGVNAAKEAGLTPTGVAPSRPACSECTQTLKDLDIPITGP